MAKRLGIDVGGTFTDLVFLDEESGELVIGKGPTTPAREDDGVLKVLQAAVSASDLAGAEYFLHGTTVGINALLQRKGARVGLLATAGFRDILEIRRGDRMATYDVAWTTPEPLVPRYLRLPIRERVMADGTIATPIELDDVVAAWEVFATEDVDCVAIVFLNSYTNPAHELAAADALRQVGFGGEIALSHAVSGEFREYERMSTTVVDAYIRPHMSAYLRRLEARLRASGFRGTCLITRSGGGAVTFGEGEKRAFETIMSGPAAGVVGAEVLCRRLGLTRVVTADVGGTSFDTALILDGAAVVRYEGEVEGMPLQAPWIDVRSIGAGGGSIALVDAGGLLRVGPESAGAVPGPISYGRGGMRPTVTDAAASLGMLGAGHLAGGLELDLESARRGIEGLGESLGLDVDALAAGVIAIANAAMAKAIRSVTIEKGEDPRAAVLIAFGGAGPLFATLIARELEMKHVIVPPYPGNFSAWGLLGEDIVREAARTLVSSLDDAGVEHAQTVIEELRETIRGRVGDESRLSHEDVAIELRYVGQRHSLAIPAPDASDGGLAVGPLVNAFNTAYERNFGFTLSEPVEMVTVRVARRTRLRQPDIVAPSRKEQAPTTGESYSFRHRARIRFDVVPRHHLAALGPVQGPMIITEPTATTYVDDGFTLEVLEGGTLQLRDMEA